MEDINTAVRNAKKRASVMSALDGMYKNTTTASSQSTLGKRRLSDPDSKMGGKERMASNLVKVVGDLSDKFRSSIDDQIVGKTIVLEKKQQSETAALKVKRAMQSRKRSSNRELKRKSCHPCQLLMSSKKINNRDVEILHRVWWSYCSTVLSSCKTRAQVQSRMLSMDMVGSHIMVVERCDEKKTSSSSEESHATHVWGTVVAETANLFIVAQQLIPPSAQAMMLDTADSESENRAKVASSENISNSSSSCKSDSKAASSSVIVETQPTVKRRRRCRKKKTGVLPLDSIVHAGTVMGGVSQEDACTPLLVTRRYVKSNCVFAIKVPAGSVLSSKQERDAKKESSGIVLIHGKTFLPHLKQGFVSFNVAA